METPAACQHKLSLVLEGKRFFFLFYLHGTSGLGPAKVCRSLSAETAAIIVNKL